MSPAIGKRLITEVLCGDLPCTALVDTGAIVSLIALSTFENLLSVKALRDPC